MFMGSLGFNVPALIVIGISVIVGFLMVLLFGYTSDQDAIHAAKDQIKANLLALRLFQDQIGVVVRAYGKIILATGRYLRLAFMPLLFVIVPLTLIIAQLDHYLGLKPVDPHAAFLIKARVGDGNALNETTLDLPEGLEATAPGVHIPSTNEVDWRVVAAKGGDYLVHVSTTGISAAKRVVVGTGMPRLSTIRMRGKFWERIFVSAESAFPDNSPIESVEVQYAVRDIWFAGVAWNWIWLFFVLSLVAGFAFKSILGIEI